MDKICTSMEQSQKLAEMLPIESADMFYVYDKHLDKFYGDTPYVGYRVLNIDVDMPCWSLAALFDVVKDKCGYFELVYLKRTLDNIIQGLEARVREVEKNVEDINVPNTYNHE